MLEHVEICPEGIFQYVWKNQKWTRKRVKKALIGTQLRQSCEIVPGTTLGQIFNVVDQYKMLKLFISQYSWCHHLEEFHLQAQEPMKSEENPSEEMTHLEVLWHPHVNHTEEKIKHPGGLRERIKCANYELYPEFLGIGKAVSLSSTKEFETYSVSYTPMYDLIDYPVVLNKKFKIYEKPNRNAPLEPPKLFIEGEREFTLLEVLDAIYWDISFMGGPQENREFIEEMKERVDEIKNDME